MKKITELKNPLSENIDKMSISEILDLINNEDENLSRQIRKKNPDLEQVINVIINAFKNGGRLLYVGCGSSGRLGVLDAAECPPTFSVSKYLVQGIIAGGNKALYQSIEGAEDDFNQGHIAIEKKKVNSNDVVFGISANGSAKFVLGALKYAKKNKAYTSLLTFNNIDNIAYVDKIISIIVGPEIISGSTRMKAGTATKMILNMITTTSMIKINKTYKNYMVDLKISNQKLLDRGIRIISEITGLNYKESENLLINSKNNVKVAILMELKKISYNTAFKKLKLNNGNLRKALN